MRILRTPEERFAGLPGFPFEPHYVEVAAGDGTLLRVHYLDEGPPMAKLSCCCTANRPGSYDRCSSASAAKC